MTDLNELMKQAKQMQEQFQKAQDKLSDIVVSGESGAGLVKIDMNGRYDVIQVELQDSLLSEEKEVIEDLLAAAVNDSVRKVENKKKESIGSMADNFSMPQGFKFPF